MTNIDNNGTVQVDVTQPQNSSLSVPPPTVTKQTSHGSFQTQLQAFGDKVKKIPVLPHSGDVKGVDYVYGVEKAFDGRIQLFKYGIGPLELDISYDHHTKGLVLDIYLNPPFVKKIKISTVTGSLLEGLVVKLGYGNSLNGQLTVQKVANEAVLSFHFTAFEKEYKGSVKIFSI